MVCVLVKWLTRLLEAVSFYPPDCVYICPVRDVPNDWGARLGSCDLKERPHSAQYFASDIQCGSPTGKLQRMAFPCWLPQSGGMPRSGHKKPFLFVMLLLVSMAYGREEQLRP